MEDRKIKTLNTEDIFNDTLDFEKKIRQFLQSKKSDSP